MKRGKKWLLGTTAFLLLLSGAFTWLVATEAGARWILARAEPMLPEPLTIGPVTGTLAGGLSIDAISWNDAAANVSVERVFVDVRVLPLISRRVYVDRLEVGAATVELLPAADDSASDGGLPEVRLPIDLWILDSSFSAIAIKSGDGVFEIDTVDVEARMQGADLEVDRLDVESEALSLSVDGRVRLAGNYRASVDASWRWVDDLEYAGRLAVSGNLDRYDIEHALTAPVGVASSGTLSLDDGSIDLEHEWQDVQWSVGERLLTSAEGSLTTAGTLERIDLALDAAAQFDALPESRIALLGNVDENRLSIDNASLQSELGQLDLSGSVLWTPALELDFRVSGLDPERASELLSGELSAAGQIEASLEEGAIRASVRVDEFAGDINGSEITGSAEIDWADDELTVADGEIAIGDNRVGVEGRLSDTVTMNVEFAFEDLQQLIAEAGGSLGGQLDVSGTSEAPELQLNASGADLRWNDNRMSRIAIDSTVRSEGLSIVDVRASGVALGDETIDEVEASISGNLEQHRLSFFAGTGAAELAIGAIGGLEDSGWRGEIAEFDIDSELFGNWATGEAAVLALSAESLELGELCVVSGSTDGRLCARASMVVGGDTDLNIEIDALPVAALPLGLPETTRVEGSLDARVELRVVGETVNGNASLGIRGGSLSSLIDGEELTVSFTDAGAEASIVENRGEATARFELDGGGGSASIDVLSADVFDLDAPIEGEATLSLADADVFAFLLPTLSDPYGVVEGTLELGGSPAQPEFDGALTLSDGRFGVRDAGIVVFEVNGRVEQQSIGRLRLSGSGRSGDGSVSIEGETIVGAETGIRSEVQISGENFELLRLPDWQLAASPNVAIVFDDRSAVVTGSLDIPRAAITLRQIPETAVSASPDVVVHRPEGEEVSRGRRIDIDVDVSLGEEIAFSGFGLETGLEGALRVRGGTDEPYTGVGRLSLVEGRYEAYGQELEIEIGNLIFNGPLDEPQLDVRAVRRTTDVTAGILVTGTPSQLRSELVSQPPVSDAEALSYLLTGRSLEDASDAGDGDTLNQAAFALGLSGAGAIVSQIRSDLGLDTLSVEGGSSGSRIVAGKQISDRLFVEYGYGLIDQIGELLLRYQLNDRLILESRTGSVSNLDLVYSVKKQ
ncbi:MAG: translocation/assembly module TamB domain-containing protein [Woeseiaceae bacterium]|nr:translocation/assembly module TamB domain-containing protein [Woeseiaceae bacterium]